MENVSITSKAFEMKANKYGFDENNFVAENELTVTITLNEYRELVGGMATKKADIDKANAEKYSREAEIKHLGEENSKLKSEIYELKKAIEELTAE